MSTFAWLDFTDTERDRALELIALFRDRDTVDELGVLSIWEAIADQLLPGLSTIQTRARYFFFVPWIYQRLEKDRFEGAEFRGEARKREIKLIDHLLESDDIQGTIGQLSRATLKRLPSAIYWSGLGILGFRKFDGGQARYFRALRRLYIAKDQARPRTDGDELVETVPRMWPPTLPLPPKGFPTGASHALTRVEAEFFRDRVIQSAPNSLFAFLLDRGEVPPPSDFPWEVPGLTSASPRLVEILEHARAFSEVMHGAQLTYNLMLAEKRAHKEWTSEYRELLAAWASLMKARRTEHKAWDRSHFWSIVARAGRLVPMQTRLFVDLWIGLALGIDPKAVPDRPEVRKLIEERERLLKREQARLSNQRALETWGGAAGTRQFEYRWSRPGHRIVSDILLGLTA
ncbi:MAG: DUF6361 family protein [Gemmatimonadaceae bacterium]